MLETLAILGDSSKASRRRSILKVLQRMVSTSILKVSIRQIKAARALLDWSQEQLATEADVSVPTIKRLEAQDGPLGGRSETNIKIRAALETAGVEFINENGGGPGVRLRKRISKQGK
jgi:DNA-binding XRE family transcriptional regulator